MKFNLSLLLPEPDMYLKINGYQLPNQPFLFYPMVVPNPNRLTSEKREEGKTSRQKKGTQKGIQNPPMGAIESIKINKMR